MTDNSEPDDDAFEGYFSDEESTDSSQIDEFLERLEDDQSGESVSSEPDPSEPTPTQNGSQDPKKQGRLWDSFRDDRTATDDREPPTTGIERDRETPKSHSDTPSPSTPPDNTEPPEPGGSTAADSEFSSTSPTPDSEPSETSKTEDSTSESSTSFRTILKRISHRIGNVGSGSADTESTDDSAESTTAGGADTGSSTPPPNAGSSTRGPSTAGPSSSGPTGRGTPNSESTASESRSDTIDEILNNIDLFGRATSSSQVLLLSPTAHSITNDIYSRFLLPTDGAGQNILFVSATQSASDQLGAARKIPQWREGKTAVIEVGQSTLKPTRPGTGEDITTQLDIYKQISNLKHLAKLGINISHIVSQWDNSRRPTVVGVHTLSAIQQYVGNETMFQFLFTLKGQLNSMGVMGFYHMDPAVHTDNEISTIQSAFDLVIRVSADGSVDIE